MWCNVIYILWFFFFSFLVICCCCDWRKPKMHCAGFLCNSPKMVMNVCSSAFMLYVDISCTCCVWARVRVHEFNHAHWHVSECISITVLFVMNKQKEWTSEKFEMIAKKGLSHPRYTHTHTRIDQCLHSVRICTDFELYISFLLADHFFVSIFRPGMNMTLV